jgi:hypothetical protein
MPTQNGTFRNGDKPSPTCICGRKVFPHCPGCGSKNKSPMVGLTEERLVATFRCRQCGGIYSINEHCEAPNFVFGSMKERRAFDKAADGLEKATGARSPQDAAERKAFIQGLFKQADAPVEENTTKERSEADATK